MDRLAATRHNKYDPDLYDDQAYHDDERSYDRQYRGPASHGQYGVRKDLSRTPPRGPAADRSRSSHSDWDNRYRDDYSSRDRYDRYGDRAPRSPRRDSRRSYNDWDRSPGYGRSRSRSRSRSPQYRNHPNNTIILEGLPVDMTQEDILYELQHNFKSEGLEHIRLIKDKRTGSSRGFAFVQFRDVASAGDFLDRYGSSIRFHGPSSRDSDSHNVRISFSRDRDDRGERSKPAEDEWFCDICSTSNFQRRVHCHRCNAPKTRPIVSGVMAPMNAPASGLTTTGDSDAAPDNSASQFLLIRGLEPGVTEELLAKGVSKLFKTQSEPAVKKGKISSTADSNPGAREGSLRRVLLIRDRRTNDSWRYGFAEFSSIDDASAALAKYNSAEKFTISSKPVMVSYIHSGVFVPSLRSIEDSASFTFGVLSNPSVRLMYWDEAAYASELSISNELPEPQIKPTDKPSVKDEAKTKKRKAEKETAASSKKAVAPHLQFWSNRHAELHGNSQTLDVADTMDPLESSSLGQDNNMPRQSFIDRDRNCCLLCARQFKGGAEANKHERLSQLHRDNLANAELRTTAITRMQKLQRQATTAGDGYRDRAKERRQAFRQPKQPSAQQSKTGVPATTSPPIVESRVPSIGASLLGKMGWNEGQGLGLNGSGRTQAVTTNVYAQGVGLGAEGGKLGEAASEADRNTRSSYAEFVSQTKDRAKARYQNMG